MRITFFGAYDPAYPRNAVIRKGLRLNGVDVRECRVAPKFKFWARYPLLLCRWRRLPDFLFVPEFCQKDVPLAAFMGLLTARPVIFDPLAARYETKIVDWKWKPADSPAAWWNSRIDRAAFAAAGLVLADTEAHKSYYCETYGLRRDKVEVLPLGYDDGLFKPRDWRADAAAGRSGGSFEVLFYGSFLPLHGADVIIGAARILASKDPSVRFKLVGSGRTLADVRGAAAAAALNNVEFIGWMPARELPKIIGAADVCLGIFGRTEKAGRVVPHKIFQSMGMGKPVITARTPAVEEFFEHGKNIYFCDDPLAESLAEAVLALKQDATFRNGIARRGHELVTENYSPRAIGRRLLEISAKHFGSGRRP
jgi:glycosyltransferase involved in cell wall biosynthesis